MLDKFTLRYGLIVVDDEPDENGEHPIVHFVGFHNEPTSNDARHVMDEISSSDEFGLKEIAHRLSIFPAPEDIVEFYRTSIGIGSN
jgi:hypothetical protein